MRASDVEDWGVPVSQATQSGKGGGRTQFDQHILVEKRIDGDTGWQIGEMSPRFGLLPRTRPALARWQWRSVALTAMTGQSYRLLLDVSPELGKWKAWLIRAPSTGAPFAVARFEDQPGGKCGLHMHAHCYGDPEATGPASIKMAYRLPDHGRYHRRAGGWTKALFFHEAGKIFRVRLTGEQEDLL